MPRFKLRTQPLLAVALVVLLTTWSLASAAAAHDPIFLTEDQETPETGPYLPDGSISFAVYGSLLAPGDTRGLEFDLRDGDELYLSLLIPDLEPETGLADQDLPTMTLSAPDGSERLITAEVRTPFADPFSGTDYLTLYESIEPAVGGRHQIVVTGESPSRFVVAVGSREEFFTPTERSGERPASFPAIAEPLNAWYTTPADGSPAVNAGGGDGVDVDVDVDVDMIEDATDEIDQEGAATAAAGSDGSSRDTGADNGADQDAAAAPAERDEGSGAVTWIAPLAAIGAALVGGGLYLRRRDAA